MHKISERSVQQEIWRMKKRSLFVLGVFTTAVFASQPAITVPVTQAPNPSTQQPTPPAPATTAPILTLQDLPPGFYEVPPQIKQRLADWLEPFKQVLGRANLPLNNFFAFVNLEKFEVVFGFTGILPNQQLALGAFDAALGRLRQTTGGGQQQLVSQVRERLQTVLGVELVEYRTLPELNNLANASAGMSLALRLRGQPIRVDVAGFRRNTVGAFTAVLYLDGRQPIAPARTLVTKLDNRITGSPRGSNR